jgi:hypothetical protein
MKEKKPTIALIYDFDGTLAPGNMQEHDFLEEVGITDKREFWKQNDEDAIRNNASGILCGMQLILEKSQNARKPIKRGSFQKYGNGIEYYQGVENWFTLINKFGKEQGLNIEHYIISSGLKEMIEGTSIAKYFKQIFACTFLYNENDIAYWPAVAVDFTAKVQFLWMINKGVNKISDNSDINKYVPDEERPVPFNHMIYIGDGYTDVPCMKLVKQNGGKSIAVFNPTGSLQTPESLIKDNRVNFICPADYRENEKLHKMVHAIILKMKYDHEFNQMERDNHKEFLCQAAIHDAAEAKILLSQNKTNKDKIH